VRTRSRTDSNHAAIVAALRACGCQVLSLAAIGKGAPDLLVLNRAGELMLLEVKGPNGKLTDEQVSFHEKWPVYVVRTGQEAVDAVSWKD
jgi:hypothetical protein